MMILLLCQMFLFGLRLVDLLRSPSIHLPLQLFLLPAEAQRKYSVTLPSVELRLLDR